VSEEVISFHHDGNLSLPEIFACHAKCVLVINSSSAWNCSRETSKRTAYQEKPSHFGTLSESVLVKIYWTHARFLQHALKPRMCQLTSGKHGEWHKGGEYTDAVVAISLTSRRFW